MEMEQFRKAVLDTTTTTTGNVLIPQLIDAYIIDLARKLSPVQTIIPSKPWPNLTYTYKRRTSTAPASFYGEDDAWLLNSNTYDTNTVTMKIVGDLGGVSNLLQEGSQEFVDALATEVDGVTRGVVKKREDAILNGNVNTNVKSYSGIAAQLQTNTGFSGQITFNLLDAMDDAIKSKGFGISPESCYWITTPNMSTAISRLTAPFWRSDAAPMNLVGGFATSVYRNHKILESSAAESVVGVTAETVTITNKVGTFANLFTISSTYDDQLGNLANGGTPYPAPVISSGGSTVNPSAYSISVDPFAGTSTITFTTAPSGTITATYFYKQQNLFLVDFSTMLMPILLPLSYEKLPANYAYDQQVFRVKAYEALVVNAEMGNALATNVFGTSTLTPVS